MTFPSTGAATACAPRRHRLALARLLIGLLALTALMVSPVAAAARSRSNEYPRGAIFGGFSDSELRGYVMWVENDDAELIPGVFLSVGGYSVRGDGRSESLFTAEVFNTTRHPFCLRVRQARVGGPFVGRQRLDNSGINMLVDAGGKAAIAPTPARRPPTAAPTFVPMALPGPPISGRGKGASVPASSRPKSGSCNPAQSEPSASSSCRIWAHG